MTILTDAGIEGRDTWGRTIFAANWEDLTAFKKLLDERHKVGAPAYAFDYEYVVFAGERKLKLAAGNKDLLREMEKRLKLEVPVTS